MRSENYSELHEQRKVDQWNLRYSPGIQVTFTIDSGEKFLTFTTTEAEFMCGQALIRLAGVSGCCSLDSVEPRANIRINQ